MRHIVNFVVEKSFKLVLAKAPVLEGSIWSILDESDTVVPFKKGEEYLGWAYAEEDCEDHFLWRKDKGGLVPQPCTFNIEEFQELLKGYVRLTEAETVEGCEAERPWPG